MLQEQTHRQLSLVVTLWIQPWLNPSESQHHTPLRSHRISKDAWKAWNVSRGKTRDHEVQVDHCGELQLHYVSISLVIPF